MNPMIRKENPQQNATPTLSGNTHFFLGNTCIFLRIYCLYRYLNDFYL